MYIHIPKCGGGSIEQFFKKNNFHLYLWSTRDFKFPECPEQYKNRCSPQHMHASLLEEILNMNSFDYIFTVVRNPVDRIISEYKWSIRHDSAQYGFDRWYEEARKNFHSNNFYFDNHMRPMNEFITKECEVFRFEDKCFDKLPALIDQKLKLKGITYAWKTNEILNQKKDLKARRLKKYAELKERYENSLPSKNTLCKIIDDYKTDMV